MLPTPAGERSGLLTARAGLMHSPAGPHAQQGEAGEPGEVGDPGESQQGTQVEDQESSWRRPWHALHWSGSGPEQEEQEEWQGRQEEEGASRCRPSSQDMQ